MLGQPWQDLKNAFRLFLKKRIEDQSERDVVTLIEFDDWAYTTCEKEQLNADMCPRSYPRFGTRFHPALDAAEAALANCQTWEIPVFIFMSDGGAGDNEKTVPDRMSELFRNFGPMSVHTIGFGALARHPLLQVTVITQVTFSPRQICVFSRKWRPVQMEPITEL